MSPDHDTIERVKDAVRQSNIDPLTMDLTMIITWVRTNCQLDWSTAAVCAGIVKGDAERTQLSAQQWITAQLARTPVRAPEYDTLDRQYDAHLDGARFRRGR